MDLCVTAKLPISALLSASDVEAVRRVQGASERRHIRERVASEVQLAGGGFLSGLSALNESPHTLINSHSFQPSPDLLQNCRPINRWMGWS